MLLRARFPATPRKGQNRLDNIGVVLKAVAVSLEDVVSVQVYLVMPRFRENESRLQGIVQRHTANSDHCRCRQVAGAH